MVIVLFPSSHLAMTLTKKNSLNITNSVESKGLPSCVSFTSLPMFIYKEWCCLNCGRVMLCCFRRLSDRANEVQQKSSERRDSVLHCRVWWCIWVATVWKKELIEFSGHRSPGHEGVCVHTWWVSMLAHLLSESAHIWRVNVHAYT